MKHISKLITALALGTTMLAACVEDFKLGNAFLEKAPGVDVTKDTIFVKAEYARRFLWNNYRKMYYGLPSNWNDVDGKMNMGMFETISDTWHSHLDWDGVNRMYYSGSYSAGLSQSDGHVRFSYTRENIWQAVRQAWLFIENVDSVPDMGADEKARLKAEAKVIIASRYFDLFRHYGGLPILDHAYEVSNDNEAYRNERATVEATVDFITGLLDEAAADLPWALEAVDIPNWDGRFTRAAALALKCKVLLFAASPLFNDTQPYSTAPPQDAVEKQQVWYGGYKPEIWSELLQACETFFGEVNSKGVYSLVQATGTTTANYRDAFRKAYFTRGSGGANPELLISTRIRYTYGDNYQWDYYFPQSNMYGALTPTQEYVEMFPMADGTPFSWDNPEHVATMFSARDPRLFETILVNNATYQGRQVELWVGGREARLSPKSESGQYATGYANYKFVLDFNAQRNQPTLWPYLRMAEVHLIYAEALMKAGRMADAIAEVDKIRARVGLPGLVASNPGKDMQNEAVLLEEILRERACELGLEDVRMFDLIRHKRADLFAKQLHGLRIYRADGLEDSWSDKAAADRGPRPTEFTYEVFELTNKRRSWWTQGFDTKWYLEAMPTIEVNKDYGLTQNPGW